MASAFVIVLVTLILPFFILGVLGNVGVLLCVLFTPSLRTRANAIIVSLTVSCLAFLIMVVPFTVDSFLYADWRFAVWYCHTTAYLTFAFIGITVFNIAALSLYRYFCVVHPMRMCLKSVTCLTVMITLSWLIPLGTQLLIAVFRIAHTEYVPEYARCVLMKSGAYSALYNLLVLGGFLPCLALTLYSYAGIYFRVRGSAKRLRQQAERNSRPNLQTEAAENGGPPDGEINQGREQRNSSGTLAVHHRGPNRGQSYLTKICVVVFVLFMVCYGPIVTLTVIYANDTFPGPAYMICTVVYWLGSCLHPLVYATLQPQIRRSSLRLVRCCWKPLHRLPGESSVLAVTSTAGRES